MKKCLSIIIALTMLLSTLFSVAIDVNAASVPAPTASFSSCIGGKKITIKCKNKKAVIYYKLDKGSYKKYTKAITISANGTLSTYATVSKSKSKVYTYKIYGISKLSAPSGVRCVSANRNEAILNWNYVKDAQGYNVYRASSKSGSYKKIASIKSCNFIDKTDISKAYYKVEAYANGKATSSYSAIVKPSTKHIFRNSTTLNEHYQKHGVEMGFSSTSAYEACASDVINNPNALIKNEREDGDYVYFINGTNEIVFMSTDGYIRSYFICSGEDYFNRQ